MKFTLKTIIFVAILAFNLCLGVNFASADYSSMPASSTVLTNGSLSAIIATSSGVYVGGSFTQIGNYTGSAVPIAVSTGLASTTYPKFSSDVYAVLPDSSGGWYVGGVFTQVDTYTRNYLAHVLADGSIDTNFNPNLNNTVYALALSSDGTKLYIGGDFTTVGGVTYNRVAAINTSDGTAVSAFNPNLDNTVRSLALSSDGTKLYIGGDFTTVGGVTYNRLAAVTTSNGAAVSAFNPSVSGTVYSLKFSSDNSTLYLGGSFTTIGVTTRNYIAAVSVADGTIVSAFNPNLNGTVVSMALSSDGTKLYFSGSFTTVGGVTYNRLAAVTVSNGNAISAFNPNASDTVQSISLTSDNSTLYIGGYFTTIGGTTRNYIASVTTSNGALVSAFNPNASNVLQTVVLSSDNSTLYTGGFYAFINGSNISNLAHINSSGAVDTNFSTGVGSTVLSLALSPNGSIIYAGGSFTTVGGSTYNRVAAFNTSDGSVVSAFNPNAGNSVNAIDLSSDGSTLYLGGAFTTIGGVTYNRLAAVTTSNGAAVSAFNPNVNATINTILLSSNDSTLYVGGAFTTVGGVSYPRLAAVTTSNGTAVSAFNPNVNSTVRALALTSDNATLYFGGNFTTVGGVTYNRLAAVTTSNGAAVSAFNPNVGANQTNAVLLSSDGAKLYAGGTFTSVGGSTYNRLVEVSTSDGAVVATFNPNMNAAVTALSSLTNDSRLYVAGQFTGIGNEGSHRYYAKFITAPTITTSAATSVAQNTAVFNGTITVSNTETVRGFAYGTDSALSTVVATTTESGSFSTGAFTYSSSGLTPNTTYYYRPYATNFAGTGYGSITSFTTSAAVTPTLLSPDVSSITSTSASASSTITATGGVNSSVRGFVYGTDSSFSSFVSSTTESGDFGTGQFDYDIDSLSCNTNYYIRAYASSTVAGLGYSTSESFTTEACDSAEETPASRRGGGGGGGRANIKKINAEVASSTYGLLQDYYVSTCEPYIKSFITYGNINDREDVAKLQSFLVIYEKEPLSITGLYDQETLAAVKRFQARNIDVLKFWGITQPTGNVYITTKNAINKKYCEQTLKVKCPYFTEYAKLDDNGLKVTRIKNFLNKIESENFDLKSDTFDLELAAAISRFQTKYSSRTLVPWGLNNPTGTWYQSTSKQANDLLGCFNPVRLDNGVVIE